MRGCSSTSLKKFKIKTPIGTYNPDWAVYLNRDGLRKLHFILEAKGDLDLFCLRATEKPKIHCGKQHFKALDNGMKLHVARDWKGLRTRI